MEQVIDLLDAGANRIGTSAALQLEMFHPEEFMSAPEEGE